MRAGVPVHADQWGWLIGFYPGMEPSTDRSGVAATFEAAREAFESTWTELLPTIPGKRQDVADDRFDSRVDASSRDGWKLSRGGPDLRSRP